MPQKGQPGETAPDIKLFGRASRDPVTGKEYKPKLEVIEGQPGETAPGEAESQIVGGEPEPTTAGPVETGGEQTTQDKLTGKYKTREDERNALLSAQTEGLKLAQELADVKRQLEATQRQPVKTPQELLAEKLKENPAYLEDPSNIVNHTQQQINQALSMIIPEMDFKRHFEGDAKEAFGKKFDAKKYDTPIRLPNGVTTNQYNLAREYLQIMGKPNESPYKVLHAIDNASDIVKALQGAEQTGAVKAVKKVSQRASESQEKPGANMAGKRQPGTTQSELYRSGVERGDFSPLIAHILKAKGHPIFSEQE